MRSTQSTRCLTTHVVVTAGWGCLLTLFLLLHIINDYPGDPDAGADFAASEQTQHRGHARRASLGAVSTQPASINDGGDSRERPEFNASIAKPPSPSVRPLPTDTAENRIRDISNARAESKRPSLRPTGAAHLGVLDIATRAEASSSSVGQGRAKHIADLDGVAQYSAGKLPPPLTVHPAAPLASSRADGALVHALPPPSSFSAERSEVASVEAEALGLRPPTPTGRLRQHKGNVALCFFGLTRSLSYTLHSIHAQLLQPLEGAGYVVDVFLHTYNLTYLANERSHEATALNASEWKLLRPVEAEITSQGDFLDAHRSDVEVCKRPGSGWPFEHSFQTMTNHLCQLNSLERVAALWQKHHPSRHYSIVIYARPDVLYNCRLNVDLLHDMPENVLLLPNHSQYNGLNDRFAMSRPSVAAAYGARLQHTLAKCGSKPVHAERSLKDMVHELNITVVDMPSFYFYRIRANGMASHIDVGTLQGCDPSALDDVAIPFKYAKWVMRQRSQMRTENAQPPAPSRPRTRQPSKHTVFVPQK